MRKIRVLSLWLGLFVVLGCEDSSSVEGEAASGEESPVDSVDGQGRAEEEALPGLLCESCEDDGGCGEGLVCVTTEQHGAICTSTCSASLNDCQPGYVCLLTGTTSADFHCLPKYGSCEGDGLVCSPCAGDGDCGEGVFAMNPALTWGIGVSHRVREMRNVGTEPRVQNVSMRFASPCLTV